LTTIGSRIGVFSHADEEKKILYFLGFGIYECDEVPPSDEKMEEQNFLYRACIESNVKNPKLQLDNGKVIFGCECWWCPEEKAKKIIEAYEKEGYEIKTQEGNN